jgi:hypothetical protein
MRSFGPRRLSPVSGLNRTFGSVATGPPVPARLYLGSHAEKAELVLDAPAGAVAPGQAVVLYDGGKVLGGGWIRRPSLTHQRLPLISEPFWLEQGNRNPKVGGSNPSPATKLNQILR